MSEKRIHLYELLAANSSNRREIRERWRWAKRLEKAMTSNQSKIDLKRIKS